MGDETPRVAELRIKAAIGDHEKECREVGPISKMRAEIAELRGWAKVLAVGIVLIPLWLAVGGWALSGFVGDRIDRRIDRAVRGPASSETQPGPRPVAAR